MLTAAAAAAAAEVDHAADIDSDSSPCANGVSVDLAQQACSDQHQITWTDARPDGLQHAVEHLRVVGRDIADNGPVGWLTRHLQERDRRPAQRQGKSRGDHGRHPIERRPMEATEGQQLQIQQPAPWQQAWSPGLKLRRCDDRSKTGRCANGLLGSVHALPEIWKTDHIGAQNSLPKALINGLSFLRWQPSGSDPQMGCNTLAVEGGAFKVGALAGHQHPLAITQPNQGEPMPIRQGRAQRTDQAIDQPRLSQLGDLPAKPRSAQAGPKPRVHIGSRGLQLGIKLAKVREQRTDRARVMGRR